MAEPINGEMSNDRDEPGGKAGLMFRLLDPGPETPEVVRAQCFTRAREHIHHIVVVLGIMPDGCEDETPVPIQEQVPRGIEPAPQLLGHPLPQGWPWTSGWPSCCGAGSLPRGTCSWIGTGVSSSQPSGIMPRTTTM